MMAFAVKATCMYSLVFLFWEEEGGQPMERSLAVLVLNCRISTTQSPCTRSRLVLSCCPCLKDIRLVRHLFLAHQNPNMERVMVLFGV